MMYTDWYYKGGILQVLFCWDLKGQLGIQTYGGVWGECVDTRGLFQSMSEYQET